MHIPYTNILPSPNVLPSVMDFSNKVTFINNKTTKLLTYVFCESEFSSRENNVTPHTSPLVNLNLVFPFQFFFVYGVYKHH